MEHQARASVSRREFVRRAAMGAVAAGAAGRLVGWSQDIARATIPSDSADEVPPLTVDQPVSGVAAAGDRLVAVGGHPGQARVWSHAFGAQGWQVEAVASQFPAGTGLRAVARSADSVVAAGWSEGGSGPHPALFRSQGAASWDQVETGMEQMPGSFTAVAGLGGQLLAVGARFAEPDVGEPVAAIAASAPTGGSWSPVSLEGVERTTHGAITLLANVPEGLLLAVTDVTGLALYLAPSALGPWRRIGPPRLEPPAAIVAAGALGTSAVLAAIDSSDNARFFLGGSRRWREVQRPASLPAAARVMDLAYQAGVLVAAGDTGALSFVEEVTVG